MLTAIAFLLSTGLHAASYPTGARAQVAFVKELVFHINRVQGSDAPAMISWVEGLKPTSAVPAKQLAVDALLGSMTGRVDLASLLSRFPPDYPQFQAAGVVRTVREYAQALPVRDHQRLLEAIAQRRQDENNEVNGALAVLFDGNGAVPAFIKAVPVRGQSETARRVAPWHENPLGDYFVRYGAANVKLEIEDSVRRKDAQSLDVLHYNVAYVFFRLPRAYQKLLSKFGVTFNLRGDSFQWAGYAHPLKRRIDLRANPYTGYFDDGKSIAGNRKLWLTTQAGMRHEVRHYLANVLKFDTSARWRNPAAEEVRGLTPPAIALIKQLSKRKDVDVLADLNRRWNGWQPNELLAIILDVRDLLLETSQARAVDKRLRQAFPKTYDLVLEFEALILAQAR